MQYFKATDPKEVKLDAIFIPLMQTIALQRDTFFDEAYQCFVLGEVLYDTGRAPLANAIDRDVFRESYPVIFEAFAKAGTAESYLTVFKKIFGDDVTVEFTIPAPGKLQIDIEAEGFELSKFIARHIQGGVYEYDYVVDDVGDNIVFQSLKGFISQYELEQMLYEMVPDGIWTQITLDI